MSQFSSSETGVKDAQSCVLYVEDDVDHAELVLRSLGRSARNTDVVHVEDGEAALDYLSKLEREEVPRPWLILLDLKLPKVDGMDVLRVVKTSPGFASIPVVILTTSASPQDICRAYEQHVNSYLVKPDDFGVFDALIQEVGNYWLVLNTGPATEH